MYYVTWYNLKYNFTEILLEESNSEVNSFIEDDKIYVLYDGYNEEAAYPEYFNINVNFYEVEEIVLPNSNIKGDILYYSSDYEKKLRNGGNLYDVNRNLLSENIDKKFNEFSESEHAIFSAE